MKHIERRLRREIGLDAASVGSSLIERTVRLRMKNLGVSSPDDYARLLETSRVEWDELVESVVVTETWFFRDRGPFEALVQLVRQEWWPPHPVGAVRLLSLPCASGEEPYSLAMALLDAGVPPERFTIDAVDISRRALARAQRAVYGRNSFRGKELDFRNRHFRLTAEGYALQPRVRESVKFRQANLLGEHFLAREESYDFIFCRNLLIYFDRDTQARALAGLHRLLSPEGVLFVGPAEMPLATAQGFVSANLPMAFACRKSGVPVKPSSPTLRRTPVRPSELGQQKFPMQNSLPGVERPASEPGRRMSDPRPRSPDKTAPANPRSLPLAATPPDLTVARQLADAGRFAEAAAICQAHLEQHGPSAQAFYLSGLVHDATGDPRALECYRKALYLEPDHHETLLQLSLLLEKNGDPAGAAPLRRRLRRIEARQHRAPLVLKREVTGRARPKS